MGSGRRLLTILRIPRHGADGATVSKTRGGWTFKAAGIRRCLLETSLVGLLRTSTVAARGQPGGRVSRKSGALARPKNKFGDKPCVGVSYIHQAQRRCFDESEDP